MKIILCNPPSLGTDDDHLEPQLGLLYIAGMLQYHGYDVQIYEMTGCKNEKDIKDKIENIPYGDVYGFTTYCTNYPYIKQSIKHIHSCNCKAKIILGGPNATALPQFTLEDSGCDYVITGEGELAFLYILQCIEHDLSIDNIFSARGYENIDQYPYPAWNLIDLNKFNRVLNGKRVVSILSSRGCDNNCTHCNSVIMGGGSRKFINLSKVRYRSTKNIIKEIKYLQSLGFNNFRFNDDIFTSNPNLKELLYEISKLDIKYRIFARLEHLTEENCKLLSESGCKHIAIGLESLNPDNLKFLRKTKQIGYENNISIAKKYGLTIRVYFIVGLIHDTDETIEKYFKIASELPFDEFALYPLIPYPGTQIWKTPEKFGYEITDKDFTQYYQIGENRRTCFALKHKNFETEDVKRWVTRATEILERNKIHSKDSETK